MKAVEFEEVNIRIAEDQPEYITLPAFFNKQERSVTICFELSPEERKQVANTGKIYYKQLTGGGPMQPINMS